MRSFIIVTLGLTIGCGCGGGGESARPVPGDAACDSPSNPSDAATHPSMISPPNGSVLEGRRQLFVWTGGGSNYRLRVGTTAGAADLYESPPLGTATSVTVDHLPLSGATIFVELLSGSGSASTASTTTYRAASRKGLCVVVDFADKHLEDWQGQGMRSLQDVTAQLHEMEAHWNWLSRGLENTQWNLIRVELPQNLTSAAYPGFNEFRDAVVLLAKQQIDVADYDVDGDGVIDAIWAIAADNGITTQFLNGGTSQNQGANIFVDGQDDDSVKGRVTGNFNHEFAHTVGIQDLYGDYGTLQDLSLMANSWPLPPNDFSAFERIKLGWVAPLVIDHATADIIVPDANDHLFAIKIPTARPEEYFLVEYRKRPASGYASAASFDFDGLAVYHVFEASDQNVDPPLLKLEPADGTSEVNQSPVPNDLAFPGNPDMVMPMELRTYFGGGALFHLDNVRRTPDGSLEFDLGVCSTGPGASPNLIANPSVETDTTSWITGGWQPAQATFAWADIGAGGSQHSLSISSAISNDVEWSTHVPGLEASRAYYMCGSIKADGVSGGDGGTISISGTFIHTPSVSGTSDWKRVCTIVTATSTSTDVACRLGGFASTSSGEIWCDDVSLLRLDSAF